jgi:hypothetical protein
VICLALTFTVCPVPLRRFIPSLAALAMLSTPLLQAGAQRRPGVGMGFYTTTGLPSADVEVGPVTSTTALAEAPLASVSLVLSAPVKKSAKRAWIAGARLTPLGVGNGDSCFVTPTVTGCQDVRFEERAALLAGGAFDIRSTVLRTMVGPAWYSVQGEGARIGATLRLDYAAPRLRGATPTLFFTRTFLGSQRGEGVAMSTLGVGLRWVRKQ